MSELQEIQELKFRKFIKMRAQGESMSRILHRIGICRTTYNDWAHKDDNDIPFFRKEDKGRPRKTSIEEDLLIVEVTKENRWSTLNDIKDDERIKALNLDVTDRTLYYRLNQNGVKSCIAAVKEKLEEHHKVQRINHANRLQDWTFNEWSKVIFIDEFGITTGDCGNPRVWRLRGTRYEHENIALRSNQGHKSFSFIASFSFHGIGPIKRIKRLNKETYKEYLEENILLYINEKFEDGDFMILHDNHAAHNSHFVRDWIAEKLGNPNDILVRHPARSPDLNPCEHLGSMLKRLVRSQRPTITDIEELWAAVLVAHGMLANNREFFINLIHSMPERLNEVLRNEGNITHY